MSTSTRICNVSLSQVSASVTWYISTGDYVVIEQISEGHKVQAEIKHILYQEQIKALKSQHLWYAAMTSVPR